MTFHNLQKYFYIKVGDIIKAQGYPTTGNKFTVLNGAEISKTLASSFKNNSNFRGSIKKRTD
ncbi:MAG: hypothetical protein F4X50_09300 [Synechococcus sp. SB0662_bin_14]|nr:hypothetical protein [Synechococcus sp. SB0662_bin_14]